MLARLSMGSEPTSRAACRWRLASCIALALLAGCAETRSTFGWVDRQLYGTAEGAAKVAYADVDRAQVYSQPNADSAVQGVLALHEEVARYQSDRGFAFVEAKGVRGWVREQQLAASRPRARKPAPSSQPAEAEPAAEPAPAEEPAPAPDEEPERSVFDPY